jgi:hypothetical protein
MVESGKRRFPEVLLFAIPAIGKPGIYYIRKFYQVPLVVGGRHFGKKNFDRALLLV